MAENINSYIIDSSFTLGFLLPDEHAAIVDKIFTQFAQSKIQLESTHLLPFEVTNAIKMAFKRKRITQKQAAILISSFLKWDIKMMDVKFAEVLKIASKNDLTAYDASYLWLSRKKGLKLLTLDEKLQKLK